MIGYGTIERRTVERSRRQAIIVTLAPNPQNIIYPN